MGYCAGRFGNGYLSRTGDTVEIRQWPRHLAEELEGWHPTGPDRIIETTLDAGMVDAEDTERCHSLVKGNR